MSLLAQAATDCQAILEDSSTGFGLAMTVTNPDGVTATITGFAADIGQQFDADMGVAVSGRHIHATLPIAACTTAFGAIPEGSADATLPPWRIALQLPNMAAAQTYKVAETMPDKNGAVVCILEFYR